MNEWLLGVNRVRNINGLDRFKRTAALELQWLPVAIQENRLGHGVAILVCDPSPGYLVRRHAGDCPATAIRVANHGTGVQSTVDNLLTESKLVIDENVPRHTPELDSVCLIERAVNRDALRLVWLDCELKFLVLEIERNRFLVDGPMKLCRLLLRVLFQVLRVTQTNASGVSFERRIKRNHCRVDNGPLGIPAAVKLLGWLNVPRVDQSGLDCVVPEAATIDRPVDWSRHINE